MRAAQLDIDEVSTLLRETSNRMIIDVNATPEDARTTIREVVQRVGSGKVTIVQAIQAVAAPVIEHQWLYREATR